MHPLAAPGTLWVLSSDGKYLVRPQADETSHKKQISCARQGKGPILLFPYHREFRLCGGDQRAFRSPFGNLRAPCCARDLRTRNRFLADGKGKSLPYFFPYHRRFRLSGGDQRAFRSPFGKPSGPYLLKRLRARKLNLSSSSFQQSDAVSGSYARLSSPGTRGVIAPVCTSASRCSGLVSNT